MLGENRFSVLVSFCAVKVHVDFPVKTAPSLGQIKSCVEVAYQVM